VLIVMVSGFGSRQHETFILERDVPSNYAAELQGRIDSTTSGLQPRSLRASSRRESAFHNVPALRSRLLRRGQRRLPRCRQSTVLEN